MKLFKKKYKLKKLYIWEVRKIIKKEWVSGSGLNATYKTFSKFYKFIISKDKTKTFGIHEIETNSYYNSPFFGDVGDTSIKNKIPFLDIFSNEIKYKYPNAKLTYEKIMKLLCKWEEE